MTESEEDDDDEDHYFSSPKLFAGARPDNDGDRSEPDEASVVGEDEDDFIVDDEIDAAQGPALPVAFSMSTHQDMSHHFKIICQLFVHLAVTSRDQRCRVMNCLSESMSIILYIFQLPPSLLTNLSHNSFRRVFLSSSSYSSAEAFRHP